MVQHTALCYAIYNVCMNVGPTRAVPTTILIQNCEYINKSWQDVIIE